MSDPVPAIAETDAVGETAAIFTDIRTVLGVSVVNLIWRRLATVPGALAWTWGTLRPLYVDGTFGSEAASLRNALALPELPRVPAEVFAAAGLSDTDLASTRNVLAAYDRTNGMALIALSAALGRLAGGASDASEGTAGRSSPVAHPTALKLPILLNLTDMSSATAELVSALNCLGTRRKDPVLASMYRHLAHWPPYLALAWTLIAPIAADGRLGHAITDAVAMSRARADRLASRLPTLSGAALGPEALVETHEILDLFTADVIAKMVVITALLRKASRPA